MGKKPQLLVAVWRVEVDRYSPDADPTDGPLVYLIDHRADEWLSGGEPEPASG